MTFKLNLEIVNYKFNKNKTKVKVYYTKIILNEPK